MPLLRILALAWCKACVEHGQLIFGAVPRAHYLSGRGIYVAAFDHELRNETFRFAFSHSLDPKRTLLRSRPR